MGRPRKPRHVLEDTGAFRKDPARGRARANEATADGPVGEPPSHFNAGQRALWYEIASESPAGLTMADRKLLELTTVLTRRMRTDESKLDGWLSQMGKALERYGMDAQIVADLQQSFREGLPCKPRELNVLSGCLAKMGMQPQTRAKVLLATSR